MIYNCYTCGWPINRRTAKDKQENVTTNYEMKNVGAHLTYKNMPFCSQPCIDDYKYGLVKKRRSPQDWWENGIWGNWRKERRAIKKREK